MGCIPAIPPLSVLGEVSVQADTKTRKYTVPLETPNVPQCKTDEWRDQQMA